jgi:7-cyano-7-deazaguanine synthase
VTHDVHDATDTIPEKGLVLFSGGQDSTTCLAWALARFAAVETIGFDYGQRHRIELDCAKQLAERMQALQHIVVPIDLRRFGGSALTSDLAVPKDRPIDEMSRGIPITYVPARNTIFLSFALAWAEVLGADDIFIGVNALDYSGYPDCRPEYIEAFQKMANLATKAGVEGRQRLTIHTPLIRMTKAEIIRQGLALGVDFALTTSCYDPAPDGKACGRCDACLLRLKGFAEAGAADPRPYTS